MNLKQLVGQMIMPGFSANFNNTKSENYKRVERIVKKYEAGGFVIFLGSLLNYAWITNALQKISNKPLLFGADFERGLAMRIEGMTQYPHNMALGMANDRRLTYKFGEIVAKEGLAIGIHQNYAPVVDLQEVYDNPIVNIRSFSGDPQVVSAMAAEFVKAYKKYKAIATAKHFPGHGATDTDSHQDIPVIDKSFEKLYSEDLVPYKAVIREGIQSIMVGHLIVPALDPEMLPATLSPKIIKGILRDELCFDGLIVTDAMNMQAICNYYSVREATVMTVKAGADVVLVSADDEVSFNSLYDAVKEGEIPVERIKESVVRILSAKSWLGLYKNKEVLIQSITEKVNSVSGEVLADSIAAKALRIKFPDNPLSLPLSGHTACLGISDRVETSQETGFHELVNKHFTTSFNFIVNNKWQPAEFTRIAKEIDKAECIIIPVFLRIRSYQGKLKLTKLQERIINYIRQSDKNYFIIAFGDPFFVSGITGLKNLILAYSDSFHSQKAVIEFLRGKLKIPELP